VGGAGVPGEAHRQAVDHRLRPGARDGVPDPRRQLRALVAPGRGAARRAVRSAGRARLRARARPHQRHLLPDRPGDADRTGGEERDPDRGVRQPGDAGGAFGGGRGDQGRANALPAPRHDVARVLPGRVAARPRLGRRRGCAPLDGNGRSRRHAGGNLRRHALHPALLRAAGQEAQGKPRRDRRAGSCRGRRCPRSRRMKNMKTGSPAAHRLPGLAMTRARAIALALSALLAGCAVGPDYQRPAIEMPGEYTAPEVGTQSTVSDRWWTLYGDATLDQLVTDALQRNADIELAVARVAEAEGTLKEAGASLFPEIDAGVAASRTRVSSSTALANPPPLVRNDVRAALATSFEIDFWGRLR